MITLSRCCLQGLELCPRACSWSETPASRQGSSASQTKTRGCPGVTDLRCKTSRSLCRGQGQGPSILNLNRRQGFGESRASASFSRRLSFFSLCLLQLQKGRRVHTGVSQDVLEMGESRFLIPAQIARRFFALPSSTALGAFWPQQILS